MKQYVLGVLAVAVLVSILDYLIHNVLLMSTYEATAELWRPPEEFKGGLMALVTVLISACFVGLYAKFCSDKSLKAGVLFGLIFGLANGVSMGYGSYCFMPIPYSLALSWFLASTIEGTSAGAVAGLIVKGASES